MLLSCSAVLFSCGTGKSAGPISAQINKKGELILAYPDGTIQNVGVVVGEDGIDGQDGKNGVNGKDGADGQNGADGKDGIDGQDGKDGKDGKDGADGSGDSTVIIGEGSDVSAAISKGLRSAVSIICNFQSTAQSGIGRPGSSGSQTQSYSSAGSGVIYQLDKESGEAFIITNYHVVYDASCNTENGISDDISVYLYGSEVEERAIEATYVGGSLYYDIAVLYIEDSEVLKASDVCEIDIADSDKVAVGSYAIAIGNPEGYGISASLGIVSVDSEHITMTAADNKTEVSFRVMRIDAAVNHGNSGGGLFDDEGNLIGIVNAKIIEDGVEGIGYAIPSKIAIAVANNIIDYCHGNDSERVQRALLGVTVGTADSKAVYDSATGLMTIEESVFVYEISDTSIAKGVLQADDVLISATLNDITIEITRQHHIVDMMLDARVGDVIDFSIVRGGTEMTVSITITETCLTEY